MTGSTKLCVCGLVDLRQSGCPPCELRRGMIVFSAVGHPVGLVAAVVEDCVSMALTHFLLGDLPPTGVYRLIPLTVIDRIDREIVTLSITSGEIETLPVHDP